MKRAAVAVLLLASGRAGATPAHPSTWTDESPRAATFVDSLVELFPKARHWWDQAGGIRYLPAPGGGLTPDWATVRHPRVLRHDTAWQRIMPVLPARADGTTTIALDGMPGFWVETTPLDAASSPVAVTNGLLVYEDVWGGDDLVYKLTPTHVDEYVHLTTSRARYQQRFRIAIGPGVGALDAEPERIEVFDRAGVARLRLEHPFARDANWTRREGTVSLDGDVVTLTVDLDGLTFPVLIDPDWETTGRMIRERFENGAVVLPGGDVLAPAGCTLTVCPQGLGMPICSSVLDLAERYDPVSGTWREAAALTEGRFGYAWSSLPGGEVLLAGGCTTPGCTGTTASVELYDGAIDAWSPLPALGSPRAFATATPLPGGDVLVVGGCDVTGCTASAEIFDATLRTWRDTAPLSRARGLHRATALPGGEVLVTGGCGTLACGQVLDDAELYDPATGAWRSAGTMSRARAGHSATLLDGGDVLVAGGCASLACDPTHAGVEQWLAATGQWLVVPSMGIARHDHSADRLADGTVLVVGGCNQQGCLRTSERWDPGTGSWSEDAALEIDRGYHASTLLSDGRLLVTGGCNGATCIPWADTYPPPPARPDGGTPAAADGGVTPPWTPPPYVDESCTCRAGGRARGGASWPALALVLVPLASRLARRRATPALVAALAIASAAALAACGRAHSQPGKLVVGAGRLRISMPVFLAAERGLFARHGLDVELRLYDTAQPMVDDVTTGRIDAGGFAAWPIVLLSSRHAAAPPRVFGSLVEDRAHRQAYVLARAGSGLAFPRDAAGKRIGVLPTVAFQAWLAALLRAGGVDPTGVTVVPLAPPMQAQALVEGGVDFLFTGDPMATALLQPGAAELADGGPPLAAHLGEPFDFGTFVIAGELARDRPADAAALVAAIDEAIAILRADPAAGRAAMARHVRPAERAWVEAYPDARYLRSSEVEPGWLDAEVARERALGILGEPVEVRAWSPPSAR